MTRIFSVAVLVQVNIQAEDRILAAEQVKDTIERLIPVTEPSEIISVKEQR